MANGKEFDILFLDVELEGENLGRIIIEPNVLSPSSPVFSQYFQSNTSSTVCTDALATVVEVAPNDLVQFEWNFNIPLLQPGCSKVDKLSCETKKCSKVDEPSCNDSKKCCSKTKKCCDQNEPAPSTSTADDKQDINIGSVMMCKDTSRRFCVVTSLWYATNQNWCPGDFVGKIYKGMSLIKHLATLNVGAQNRPLQICKVTKAGVIEPGRSLNLQPIDAVLDQYPTCPSDAVGVDFADLECVRFIAYGIKTSGSMLFRQGKYHMAMSRFKKAVRYLTYAAEQHPIDRDQEVSLLTTIIPCILDSASCKLKLKDFDGAIEDCNEALEISPLNAKAFFRRGQAQHRKMNYTQSLTDLYTALKLVPNEKCIRNEIIAVQGEMRVYEKSKEHSESGNNSKAFVELCTSTRRRAFSASFDDDDYDDMPDLI